MYGGEWNDSRYEAGKRKKLKVGYFCDKIDLELAPGIRNTVMETVKKLEEANHTVIRFHFP